MTAGTGRRGLRVLMVCHYYPPHVGGIENVVQAEAVRLAALGHEVTVLTSGERTGVADEPVSQNIDTAFAGAAGRTVRVVRIAAWNGAEERAGVPFPITSPRLLPQALRWARWADVVHVHDCFYLTSWAGGLASALTRTPLVLTQHVAMVEHPSALVRLAQKAVYGTIGRALLRRARTVFTINDYIARFVGTLGAPAAKVTVLGNGVDGDLFRPPSGEAERTRLRERHGLPQDRVLALFVGRLVPKKGIDLVFAAGQAISALDVVVAGSGDAAQYGAGERVHLLGPRPAEAVAELYRACDLFVLPTTGEVFPLAVKEAMSAGLPVVTTDEPDYAHAELENDTLALVPREAAAVRGALAALAGDGARRERMGAAAAAYAAKHFSWTEHVTELAERYRAATGTQGVGPADPGGGDG
jgi:D-inositol-3-phosphate glycosyltransferase